MLHLIDCNGGASRVFSVVDRLATGSTNFEVNSIIFLSIKRKQLKTIYARRGEQTVGRRKKNE